MKEQDQILNKITTVMKNSRVGSHKTLLPFQKGIILSNTSLKELLKYLKEKYSTENFKIVYIITYRINQDVLENFFSFIRGMGAGHTKPSALQFRYRLRWYILGKHYYDMYVENCNTEDDADETLICAEELQKIDQFNDVFLTAATENVVSLLDVYDQEKHDCTEVLEKCTSVESGIQLN